MALPSPSSEFSRGRLIPMESLEELEKRRWGVEDFLRELPLGLLGLVEVEVVVVTVEEPLDVVAVAVESVVAVDALVF